MTDIPEYIILSQQWQRNLAIKTAENAPAGTVVHFIPPEKVRTKEQNSYQWGFMLECFAKQGWFKGRQLTQDQWHWSLKYMFLPGAYEPGITKKGYVKWIELANGQMHMVGSTTMLTVKGMTEYLEKCMAFGSSDLGIVFDGEMN